MYLLNSCSQCILLHKNTCSCRLHPYMFHSTCLCLHSFELFFSDKSSKECIISIFDRLIFSSSLYIFYMRISVCCENIFEIHRKRCRRIFVCCVHSNLLPHNPYSLTFFFHENKIEMTSTVYIYI